MVANFDFITATRIVFGDGRVKELPELAREFGGRALVVTGSSTARVQPILDSLEKSGLAITLFAVTSEPTIATVQYGAELARSSKCECVISIGGGSVIDGGKAIAALTTSQGELIDYLEVIGKAAPLTAAPLPFLAVPTTAGAGAEVTRNAVLHSPEHQLKVSLRSPLLIPRVALIDPVLTHELPLELTASTGMDALTQLIEPFVSKRATPLTDALCREALARVARSLYRAFENGADAAARSDMALSSLCGGMALANAGLGVVHGLASPIGGKLTAAHGAVCASLLAVAMEVNIREAQEQKLMEVVRRYNEVGRLLTGVATARAGDAVHWVRNLTQRLRISKLAALGVQPGDFTDLAEKALQSSSMQGNPVALTAVHLTEIMDRSS